MLEPKHILENLVVVQCHHFIEEAAEAQRLV